MMQTETAIPDLLDHIIARHQATGRRTLDRLLALAESVEDRHRRCERYPHGLADLLNILADDLEDHQQKEEAVLFPLLRFAGDDRADPRLARMRADHDDLLAQLDAISALTGGFSAPRNADAEWRRLYALCTRFSDALRRRLELETCVLVARTDAQSTL